MAQTLHPSPDACQARRPVHAAQPALSTKHGTLSATGVAWSLGPGQPLHGSMCSVRACSKVATM